MKVCFFGDYDPAYARNRVLIKGLRKNGVEVIECNDQSVGFFLKIKNLYSQHKKIGNDYDIIIVGYSPISRFAVSFARLISRKKIVWDAFFSLYDAWVFDKKVVKPKSVKAGYYYFLDFLSCVLADKILLDTDEHIKYFVEIFKIEKEKFVKVLVGSDEDVFFPREKKAGDRFIVHFHGSYIPLQGAKYIIRAAEKLKNENIIFRMVGGRGQERLQSVELAKNLGLKNIEFVDSVPYEKLQELIADSDLCLGIFGDTAKTQRVIPNKIYESIAMRKGVITADTPAIHEFFTNRKNILLCRTADAEDLAEKILELRNDSELRKKIAGGARDLFEKYCLPEKIVKKLLEDIT